MTVLEWLKSVDEYQNAHKEFFGKFYSFVNALFMAIHVLLVRVFNKQVNPTSIVNNEMVFSVLSTLYFNHLVQGEPLYSLQKKKANILLARGLIAFPGFTSNVLGSYFLPSQVFIVLNNSNMIFAILIAIFAIKKYPNRIVVGLIATFIFGVIVMIAPEWIGLKPKNANGEEKEYKFWMVFFPLVSGLSGGIITNLLQVYASDISVFQNSFWFSLPMVLLTGLITSGRTDPEKYVQFNFREVLCLPILGLLMTGCQITFSLACKYEKRASVVTPILSANILITYLLDILLLGSKLSFVNAIGASIVFASIVGIALFRENNPVSDKK